jgi:hypothetical protein
MRFIDVSSVEIKNGSRSAVRRPCAHAPARGAAALPGECEFQAISEAKQKRAGTGHDRSGDRVPFLVG